MKDNKTRAEVIKPEAELVELQVLDAVNIAQASCVIEGQLTQALQGSQARWDVLNTLAAVKPQKLKL